MNTEFAPATAYAPGKIILFGEHAVVYGRPAIAVPVLQVQAEASINPARGQPVSIDAADVGRHYELDAVPDDPISSIIRLTCARLRVAPRGFSVRVRSTIPVARGLGSGAAVSVAIARALAKSVGQELDRVEVSALAFEVEKLYHGTPSGIDNTVVAFAQPVYFIRGEPLELLKVAEPFLIAIADTGISAPTHVAVGDVRRAWEADRSRYEELFDRIGDIVRRSRSAIESGRVDELGPLMNQNQELLREIGVSLPEIERLAQAARDAGASGAKLSGAGRGGNVIALVREAVQVSVAQAFRSAGAQDVLVTRIG